MNGIRHSINSPEGQEDLKILAQAVPLMRQLPPSDPHSWDYQAAIHGAPDTDFWKNKLFVNSCPHYDEIQAGEQTPWHFLIWHRYYLHYFEEAVRAVTKRNDFDLPYWNTTDPNQRNIPKQFRAVEAGGLEGLLDTSRRQGLNDGSLKVSEFRQENGSVVDQEAQYDKAIEDLKGFKNAGLIRFSSSLENMPHNFVHGSINGNMGSFETAGLDPIFWVHHANIDRLWSNISEDIITPNELAKLKPGVTYGFFGRDKQPITYSYEQAAANLYKLGTSYDTSASKPGRSADQSLRPRPNKPSFSSPKPFYQQTVKAPISALKYGDVITNKPLGLTSTNRGAKTTLTIRMNICHESSGNIDIFLSDLLVKGKDVMPNQNLSFKALSSLNQGKFLAQHYLGSISLIPHTKTKQDSSHQSHTKNAAATSGDRCTMSSPKEFVFDITDEVAKAQNQPTVRDVIHFNIAPNQATAKDLSALIVQSISLTQTPA